MNDVHLPEVKMHLYRPNEPVVARVVKNEVCTARTKAASFVRHIEFDVSGTLLEGQVLPGQSIGVIPPGTDEKGRPHAVRLYSVASPRCGEDGQGKIVSTTVKRTIDERWEDHRLFLGVASNHLCDLQAGDEVRLSGPNGKRFLLPSSPGEFNYVFFATGTGIAPFRGFLLDLLEHGGAPSARIALIMGSSYATDLLYHDLFLRLQERHPNFTYLTAISREKQADGHDPMYVQDRLATDSDRLLPLLSAENTLMYVCGLAGMEMGIFQQLARTLPPPTLEHYLSIDPAVVGDTASWNRKMLHKQLKTTKQVFLEVYA